MRRPRLTNFMRAEDGTAALEFAIVGNAFIMFLVAVFYLGLMLWDSSSLDWAVQKGARLAALSSSVSQSDVSTAVNGYLNSIGISNATVSYSVAASSGVNVATVSATMTKTYTVPLFSDVHLTLTSTAKVPQP